MFIETVTVVTHDKLAGGYHLLALRSQQIAPEVKPGQFVHLRVPFLGESVLRRPFSVFKADAESLLILYQCVGAGTRAMTRLRVGDAISLIGPLGNGFPSVHADTFPVLIAGGYGVAALYLLAERSPHKGIVFVGGAGSCDILCIDDFEQLGWETRVSTEDGSAGEQGLITCILDSWLAQEGNKRKPEFFVCGPTGMLKAAADRAITGGWSAWLSLDRHMGCGMGACLACVQKVKADAQSAIPDNQSATDNGAWKWARVCVEGPVFECREIIWEDEEENDEV